MQRADRGRWMGFAGRSPRAYVWFGVLLSAALGFGCDSGAAEPSAASGGDRRSSSTSSSSSIGEETQEPSTSSATGAPSTAPPVVLRDILVYGGGATGGEGRAVRIVFRADAPLVARGLEVPAEAELPRRLRLAFTDEAGRSAQLLSEIQALPVGFGGLLRIRPDVSCRLDSGPGPCVWLDLAPSALHSVLSLASQVVVDVREADTRPGADAAGPTIVLDPGHGGREPGAQFEELTEADLAYDLSTRVARHLSRVLPHARIVLTRGPAEGKSLDARVAQANAMDADLFVSIHLNAADEPVAHGGVTTFVLDVTQDRQALRLAARENGTSTGEVSALARLFADLHRARQAEASRRLADAIHTQTLAYGRREYPALGDRGVRSAMFYVLVGAQMPAVLLEASFLSRPEEARELRRPAYRQGLAEGIVEGIVGYLRTSPSGL